MKMLTFKKCLAATLALALPLTGAFGAVNITEQPENKTATEGTSVTLSVTAISTDSPAKALTYQWFKVGGTTVLSSSRTLTFSAVKGTDAGDYVVVVKESGVAATVDSNPATLTVNIKPRILTQPQSPLTPASEGGTASFSVTMNPLGTAPFTYTWQRKVGKNYVVLSSPNATITEPTTHTSQLSLANLQLEDVGTYRVSITNVTGTVVNSSDITLKVNLRPKIITEPAALTNLALGASKLLKVVVGGNAPFTFQWYKNNVAIPGANKDSYTVKGTTETAPGTPDLYRVEIFNPYSPGWANPLPPLETITKTISANAEVHVIRKPVIATHPTSSPTLSTVVDPINHTLTVVMAPTTNPGTYTYQWQKDGKNIADQNIATAPDPRIIAGTTTPTISFTPLSWLDRGSYRVVVKNEVGTITSKAADVKLLSKPIIVRQSPSQVFGNLGGSIKLFVVAGGTPASYKYEWFYRPVGGAFGTIAIGKAATLTLSKLSVARDGDYKCVVTTTSGSVESAVITLKVDMAPKIITQTSVVTTPPDNTYAIKTKAPVGGKIQLQVLASGTDSVENPITYQWQKAKRNIAGATSRVLELTGLTLADSGKYRCIVKNFSGAVTSNELTITIQTPPTITVQPSDIVTTIEESKLESETVRAAGAATLKYKWEKQITIPGGGTSWTALTGQTAAKLTIAKADIDLHNGTYRCVVSNEVGSAYTNEISVEVQPIPVAELGPVVGLAGVELYPSVARTGEFVRIFGKNLQYTTGVKFGTTTVVPKIESNNSILVKVPADASLTASALEVISKRGSANTATTFRRSLVYENVLQNTTIMPVKPGRYFMDGNNDFAAGENAVGRVYYEFSLPRNHRVTIACEGGKVGFTFVDTSIEVWEQQLGPGTTGVFYGPDGFTRYRNVPLARSTEVDSIYERLIFTSKDVPTKYLFTVRASLPPGDGLLPFGPFKLDFTVSKLVITSSTVSDSARNDNVGVKSNQKFVADASANGGVTMTNGMSDELRLGGKDNPDQQSVVLWHESDMKLPNTGFTRATFSMKLENDDAESESDDQFGWQLVGPNDEPILAIWVDSGDGHIKIVEADGTTRSCNTVTLLNTDFQQLSLQLDPRLNTVSIFAGDNLLCEPVLLPEGSSFGSIGASWDLGADGVANGASMVFRDFKVE